MASRKVPEGKPQRGTHHRAAGEEKSYDALQQEVPLQSLLQRPNGMKEEPQTRLRGIRCLEKPEGLQRILPGKMWTGDQEPGHA